MELIAHRINTIEELKKVPKEYGVEIDIRDQGDRLILQHDPFKNGEDFEEYLKHYNHGTIILNIKSERIEFRVIELLNKYKINKYFFLDCSFPMIYLLTKQGEKNIALRFSEFEDIGTILNMKDKVKWNLIDCFTKSPLDLENYLVFKKAGLKICLVSPELQKKDISAIEIYINDLLRQGITVNAVCTKRPDLWKIFI